MYGGGAKIWKGEGGRELWAAAAGEQRLCAAAELPHHPISNSHVGRFSKLHALNPKGITPRPRCSHPDRSR